MKRITAGLSPMAGYTDVPFRELCTSLGADFSVTEMISAAAVCFGDKKTFEIAELSEREAPCAMQLFGHDPSQMAHAADVLLSTSLGAKPCAIDINMGCPVRKIVTSGDGSALMREPERAARIVREVKNITSKHRVPLWVKIRAGWDKDTVNAPYFAALMAEVGADRITVHGRTREQMYAPSSDNGVIKDVRSAVPSHVCVIGNGDVTNAFDARRMIEETGCDGVAVGRAACGNPWIFSEIAAMTGEGSYSSPTLDERIECAIRLTSEVISRRGEYRGVREARGRAAHFINGVRGSAAVRERLNRAENFDEFCKVLRTLIGQE